MENRYACAPEHVATMQTAELRERFLVENLFAEGEVNFVYSHYDRVILAGAMVFVVAEFEKAVVRRWRANGRDNAARARRTTVSEPSG